jgi:hypothetical protein
VQRTLQLLRDWQTPLLVMCVYYGVAGFCMRSAWREWRPAGAALQRRHRICFAAVLAIVFTPSVISDFWLFMVPGPAVLGLLFVLPGTLAQPSALVIPLVFHILPMALSFAIFYLVLCYRGRRQALPPAEA